jgi:hypothetical protein
MLKFDDMLMAEGFVDFDLGDKLSRLDCTFCLALERLSEFLAIILAANIFLVYRLVIS